MGNNQKTLIQRIRSRETWKRAEWLARYKGPKEATIQLKEEDILPICLLCFKLTLVLIPIGYSLYIFWYKQKLVFYVIVGLTIPIALVALRLMDYIIKKYVIINS